MYVLGGNLGNDVQTERLYRYDPESRPLEAPCRRTHRPRCNGVRGNRGPSLRGRRLHRTGLNRALGVVESYEPGRERWTSLPDLTTARSGHAAVASGGRLVVFGGEELDGGTTIEQVETFDPQDGD